VKENTALLSNNASNNANIYKVFINLPGYIVNAINISMRNDKAMKWPVGVAQKAPTSMPL
jgi:hypothetical protein